MKSNIYCILALGACSMVTAMAGTGEIGPVELESVGVVGVPFGFHRAGNVEVAIRSGFGLPYGVTCDNRYVTTLRTSDPDRELLKALVEVPYRWDPAARKFVFAAVYLTITDSTSLRAYPWTPTHGVTPRCSLVSVRYVTR